MISNETARYYVQSAVLFAAAVSVWHGIDSLLSIYVLPNNPLLSALVCIFLGTLLYVIFSEAL